MSSNAQFYQEFSIEIPDKEAEAIHSSESKVYAVEDYKCILIQPTVDKAVDYILSQPDGTFYRGL